MTEGFLPGCYKNFPQETGESLPGYLLRLSHANGYEGIADLLRACTGARKAGVTEMVHALRQSENDLKTMSRVAVGDERHLLHHLGFVIIDGAIGLHKARVDDDAWLTGQAQVCPQCLATREILSEDWDLALVTVCTEHSCLLLDECPECGGAITWNRSHPCHCEHCGADFRHVRTSAAQSAEVDVAGDFAALAPFRLLGHGAECLTQAWDAGFRIFKGLALARRHWAVVEVPPKYLRNMRLAERHRVTQLLAQVRHDGSYHLPALAGHTENILEPLRSIPKPTACRKHAMRIWQGELGIPRPLAEALSSSLPFSDEPPGHEVFQGRPPSFYTNEDVADFLGVSGPTVYALIKARKIATPTTGEAFDIDEILTAQRFLQDGLMSLAELSMLLGIPMSGADDVRETYLPSWNPRNKADKRVDLEVVMQYHLHLLAKFDDQMPLVGMVALGELATRTTNPLETLIRGVTVLLSGAVQSFSWNRPYRWADLMVPVDDVALVLVGA
ncbi:TniQ family protein [Diaphorobacter nitroreducens]|uniref:TniQ family protein n=1 Tax=Diaphorobacter nitroreducens TaxID=164759 RepID=UPI0028AB603B|nr:TniQ family protein [Diaphorobacter nitroreducens]